jgi:2-amino-4-hydroxy-6-hydroxymethyldihydropteridine diphosphokinase
MLVNVGNQNTSQINKTQSFQPPERTNLYYLCVMKHNAIILLGSNLDQRERNLEQAERFIQSVIGKPILSSSVYESSAWGVKAQPDFLNKVIQVETILNPFELLKTLLEIELKLGRIRTEKWGPRTIDLDILFYDDLVYYDDQLTIPHAGIPCRRFTLLPLVEILPDYIHPVYAKPLTWLLERCEDQGKVQPYSTIS